MYNGLFLGTGWRSSAGSKNILPTHHIVAVGVAVGVVVVVVDIAIAQVDVVVVADAVLLGRPVVVGDKTGATQATPSHLPAFSNPVYRLAAFIP
ncbi:hypothetical protein [Serratia bockelmannii]|uniref:hypothetical protein n=1 Tax=Serratia bockelmannii TaxID=2703793 RepID=UPI003FA79309